AVAALLTLVACQGGGVAVKPTADSQPPTVAAPTAAATVEPSTLDLQPTLTVEPSTFDLQPTPTVEPSTFSLQPTPNFQPSTPTLQPTPQPPEPQAVISISLERVASGFNQPVYLTHAGDGRLFVVEKDGTIRIVQDGQVLPEPFLDIRDRVGSEASEQGLFSVAFHPAYDQNGWFFVNYTDNGEDTVVARYQVSPDDPNRASDAETVVLTVEQPYWNHNGGQLQFGPDGYLYVGMGDGGSGGDPENNGQDRSTLLGDLLRLDVDHSLPYAIPPDNSFVNDPLARPEIWAYGLRNPWRFSFDRLTGDLYVADVGQGDWEEVNYVPAETPGGLNYGWNILEGSHCFRENPCDSAGLVLPVGEYNHDFGCSITGGYVYRGRQFPALWGNYFFGDYCSGLIWGLFQEADGRWAQTIVLESGRALSSFGEDAAGELYALDMGNGEVLQLRP
ncbi:MAG: PQQ-dependent sugar dehydrogenase, partial [Chloroflexota bacterium]